MAAGCEANMGSEAVQTGRRVHFGRRGEARPAEPGSRMIAARKAAARDSAEGRRNKMMTAVAIAAGAFGIWAFLNAGSRPGDAHGKIYASTQACAQGGIVGAGLCESLWSEALQLHVAHAPVYATALECEATHGSGSCTLAGSAAPVDRQGQFIPIMTSYVMGSLGGGRYQAAPLYRLAADEPFKHRMSAAPPPVLGPDGQLRGAFHWTARNAGQRASAPAPLLAASGNGASGAR